MKETKPNIPLAVVLREKGISQGQLARNCGLSETKLSRIINGLDVPKTEEIERISKALNMNPKSLGLVS